LASTGSGGYLDIVSKPLRKKTIRKTKVSTNKMPAKAPVKAVSKTKSSGSTKRKVTSALAIKKSPAAKKAATAKKPAAAKKKTVAKSRAKIVATKPLKSFSIVETSPANWSQTTNRPSFEQIRLAAYHRWLQSGGHEGDNWLSAEQDLRGSKE
jgi:hypothetical protein